MKGEFIEVEAGEQIESGEPVIMRDGKAYPNWGFRLRKLLDRHGISGVQDPGGAELRHRQFGSFRISAMDDKYDYEQVVAFLKKHGIEP